MILDLDEKSARCIHILLTRFLLLVLGRECELLKLMPDHSTDDAIINIFF